MPQQFEDLKQKPRQENQSQLIFSEPDSISVTHIMNDTINDRDVEFRSQNYEKTRKEDPDDIDSLCMAEQV